MAAFRFLNDVYPWVGKGHFRDCLYHGFAPADHG